MSEIVFILGAGASKHCGTPLMRDFLDVARGLRRKGMVKEVETAFNDVLDAVGKLNAVHSKANLDTYNIESVYTAFEMGKLLGKLPGIDNEEKINNLIPAIRKVIGYTLEKTTKVPQDSRVNPFNAYFHLLLIISSLVKSGRSVSIITFNYDLGLDYSFSVSGKPYTADLFPDYCLSGSKQKGNFVTYLKLHGSINWGKCGNEKCNTIVPYTAFGGSGIKTGVDSRILPIISKLKELKCPECGNPLEEDPFIIPPTWNKTSYHGQIEQVWRRAAHEMSNAERIFVLGYSLPETDWFFNYLYGLSVEMETSLEGFYVYNSDPGVRTRFEALLGTSIIQGQRFHFYGIPFEDAVKNEVFKEMGIGIKTIPQILYIEVGL